MARLPCAGLRVGQQLPVHQDRGRDAHAVHVGRWPAGYRYCGPRARHARHQAASAAQPRRLPPPAGRGVAGGRHPVLAHHLGRAVDRLGARRHPQRDRAAVRDRAGGARPRRRADDRQPRRGAAAGIRWRGCAGRAEPAFRLRGRPRRRDRADRCRGRVCGGRRVRALEGARREPARLGAAGDRLLLRHHPGARVCPRDTVGNRCWRWPGSGWSARDWPSWPSSGC